MGTYISESDITAIFSSANVNDWADLDADGSPDTGRVTTAISYAEGYMEDLFRNGPYTVPLAFNTTGSQAVWKDIVAKCAAAHVYTSRGLQDDENDRIMVLWRDAEKLAMRYLAGELRFDAGLSHSGPTAPVAC